MPRRRIPACTGCREHHLRCDRLTPTCSNCRNAKPPKRCITNRFEFRETSYMVKASVGHSDENALSPGRPKPPVSALTNQEFLATNSVAQATGLIDLANPSVPDVQAMGEPGTASRKLPANKSPVSLTLVTLPPFSPKGDLPFETSNFTEDSALVTVASPSNSVSTEPGRRRTRGKVVTDPIEQHVFEFYIDYAGPWIDIVSSEKHLHKLALKEPVVYDACLAYSSLVLHLNGGLDKSVYDDFQSRAIANLIPLLSHCAGGADPALLATIVILRMAEQFTEAAEDAEYHLRGAWSLFSSVQEKWSPSMVDTQGVAFWIYLRQSIRANFLNEQGCRFNLDHVDVDFSYNTEKEEVWTNQITYLLARLCDGCWSDSDEKTKESTREQVSLALDEWFANVPSTFNPWQFSQPDFQAFPIVKYLSPWHEIAWQEYYTSRVMLAVYGSDRPSSSSNMLQVNQYLEAEIIEPARMACGVVFSSNRVGAHLNGCHLIAWCGQFFTGKEEQRVLAGFLEEFTTRTNWPNRTCYERLQEIWNGSRKTWTGG